MKDPPSTRPERNIILRATVEVESGGSRKNLPEMPRGFIGIEQRLDHDHGLFTSKNACELFQCSPYHRIAFITTNSQMSKGGRVIIQTEGVKSFECLKKGLKLIFS